ncbi:MAG: preprotein translocase subunit YajC [Novosphingobium sp.]
MTHMSRAALHGQADAANRAAIPLRVATNAATKQLSEGRISVISPAHSSTILSVLAAADPAAPPVWMQFLPLVAMGVIFWLLILRPQMRQQKLQREKIAAIKKGDQVVTGGGLVAKVIKVEELYVELELAPNVKVKAVKSTIGEVLSPTGSKPAND